MRRQRGFTLVESLVAVGLSLILMAGLIQLFAGSKRNFNLQQDLGGIQENGRFAVRHLRTALQMAGHWGGQREGVDDAIGGVLSGIGDCDQAWLTAVDEPVRGYEGAADIASVTDLPANCIPASHYVPESDLVVVRYGRGDRPVATADLGLPANASRVFVRAAAGLGAALIQGGDGPPDDLPDEDGTYNYPYEVALYFLRPCLDATATACKDNVRSLARLRLDGDTLVEEALVGGIEQMQIQYGSDLDQDGVVDVYQTADAVDNWNEVLDVRLGLIVAGRTDDAGMEDTDSYSLPGFVHSVPTDRRRLHRKSFNQLVRLRNR